MFYKKKIHKEDRLQDSQQKNEQMVLEFEILESSPVPF